MNPGPEGRASAQTPSGLLPSKGAPLPSQKRPAAFHRDKLRDRFAGPWVYDSSGAREHLSWTPPNSQRRRIEKTTRSGSRKEAQNNPKLRWGGRIDWLLGFTVQDRVWMAPRGESIEDL